jgi:hypothetical protein
VRELDSAENVTLNHQEDVASLSLKRSLCTRTHLLARLVEASIGTINAAIE